MTEIASVPVELAKVKGIGNIIEGYASVYDYPIEDKLGPYEMTTFIRHGAFAKSVKERGPKIMALFNHGLDPRFGQLPIGKITALAEDTRGLHARIELHDGPGNEDLRAALASGALWGMSVQYDPVTQDYSEDMRERNMREAKLWELGPVTFPKNEGSTMTLHSRDDMVTLYSTTTNGPGAEASTEGAAQKGAPPKADRLTLVKAEQLLALERNEKSLEDERQRYGLEGK